MREWFESLDSRERAIVIAGVFVLGALLYFLLIWEPLSKGRQQLTSGVRDARELSSLTQRAAAAARAGGGQAQAGAGNRSLLSLIDETSKKVGLADAVKRIQPDGESTVRIWLEKAEFDAVVRWLDLLQTQFGVSMSGGNLDRESDPGLVKARLTLERGA